MSTVKARSHFSHIKAPLKLFVCDTFSLCLLYQRACVSEGPPAVIMDGMVLPKQECVHSQWQNEYFE